MPDVRLRIDGTDFTGWTDVTISKSLDEAADTFSLSIADIEGRRIPPGARCEVLDGRDVFLTGHAEKPKWKASTRSLTIQGRSLLGDAVDCDATEGVFHDVDLLEFARAQVAPYGITVSSDLDDMGTVDVIVRDGEKALAVIDREARTLGMVPVSDPAGNLVLTRPGLRRISQVLQLPDVEDMDLEVDFTQRFGSMRVRGQTVWDDNTWGADAKAEATVLDPSSRSKRRLTITNEIPSDPQKCLDRALWEQAHRLGLSVALPVTLSSWRTTAGDPWEVGVLVPCRDDWMGLNCDMVVASAEFSLSPAGSTRCVLQMKPPQAYLPEDPELWVGKPKKGRRAREKVAPWLMDDEGQIVDE